MKKLLLSFALLAQLIISENVFSAALEIRTFSGPEARQYSSDIINIRFLFKEFPYLYQGTVEYEVEYLETYFKSPNAIILLVFDNDKVVGFANAIPLVEELEEIKAPFIKKGLNLDDYLYIGEVMLYPEYRKKGIVKRFYESLKIVEDDARAKGFRSTIFMMVDRPEDHPLRPEGYQPLDAMCRYFGYGLAPDMKIALAWTQVDTGMETDNTLSIWEKKIS
ncbi:GNAT family N-acetyltransferase [bacterium]|nr:MAG: GNAT family N-acetyltransferase [bacterium]